VSLRSAIGGASDRQFLNVILRGQGRSGVGFSTKVRRIAALAVDPEVDEVEPALEAKREIRDAERRLETADFTPINLGTVRARHALEEAESAVKELVALLPKLSLAVQVTVVVPTANGKEAHAQSTPSNMARHSTARSDVFWN
jgi:hypothetical protein